jgi:hypothetical protein
MKTQTVKKSDILKAAKKLLWDGGADVKGKEKYICWCIESTNYSDRDYSPLTRLIEARLGNLTCLPNVERTCYEYLLEVVGIPEDQLTRQNLQTYRHAWVDELIREFESKGE